MWSWPNVRQEKMTKCQTDFSKNLSIFSKNLRKSPFFQTIQWIYWTFRELTCVKEKLIMANLVGGLALPERKLCRAWSSQLDGKWSFCNTWGRHHGRAQQKKAAGLYLSPHDERLDWHLLGLAGISEFVARYEFPVPFHTGSTRLSRSLCTGLATLARECWCRRHRTCAHSCQRCVQERYQSNNIRMHILVNMGALRAC